MFTLAHEGLEEKPTLPCLLSIPEHTPHGFAFEPGFRGRVVTLSSAYLDYLFQSSTPVLMALSRMQLLPLHEEDASLAYFRLIFDKLMEETREDKPERALVIKACLAQLLVEIFRFSRLQTLRTDPESKNIGHFRAFQHNMRANRSGKKQIKHYARELGITPEHLNRVCKQVSGHSASDVIQEYLVTEARRYLKYTSLSISEVSYRMNFDNPGYFARLFKKRTGLTPREFRLSVG